MEEIIEENRKLKERIEELETMLQRKRGSSSRAYDEIRTMIISKVKKEVKIDIVDGIERNWTRKKVEKKIMSDLKWDLRVRTIHDFRDENIDQAKEYLEKYIIPEALKKSKWNY